MFVRVRVVYVGEHVPVYCTWTSMYILGDCAMCIQPGRWGVADWVADPRPGHPGSTGPGDPIPSVVELGPALSHPRYRPYFPALARSLGLPFWHVPCTGFASYFGPFHVTVEEQVQVLRVLQGLGLLRTDVHIPAGGALGPAAGPPVVVRPRGTAGEAKPGPSHAGWRAVEVDVDVVRASSRATSLEDVFVCVQMRVFLCMCMYLSVCARMHVCGVHCMLRTPL